MTSGKLDNKQNSLLLNLGCRSNNEFRDNQYTLYGKEPICLLCQKHIDSQENALGCKSVTEELKTTEKELLHSVKYSDLFEGEEEQLQVTRASQIILTTRERLLTNRQWQGLLGPHNSGPD